MSSGNGGHFAAASMYQYWTKQLIGPWIHFQNFANDSFKTIPVIENTCFFIIVYMEDFFFMVKTMLNQHGSNKYQSHMMN